jgi:molybdate transport system permease protein
VIYASLKLSLLVVSLSTAIAGVVGLALAYLLAKRDFIGKDLIDSLVTLPMVLPPTVTGYYLLLAIGRQGPIGQLLFGLTGWTVTFTWVAASIACTVMALPLMVKTSRAAIESVESQYEAASYTLGKGEFETFFRITVPLARKGIIAGLVLSFTRALGEFGATLMIAGNIPGKTQTMPLAVYEAVISGEERRAQLLALLLTAVSIITVYTTHKLTRPRTL